MKIGITAILLIILFASCKSDVKKEKIETDSTIYFQSDSLHAVVFKPNHRINFASPDTSMSILEMWPILLNDGWIPSKENLLKFKTKFIEYAKKSHSDSLAKLYDLTEVRYKLEDINKIEYQFVGYIDTTDAKRIFVNIGNWDGNWDTNFGTSGWQNDWIFINDGGGTYHSIYNADTDSIELLEFN